MNVVSKEIRCVSFFLFEGTCTKVCLRWRVTFHLQTHTHTHTHTHTQLSLSVTFWMCHGAEPHTCPVLSVCQLWEPGLSPRYRSLHMQIPSSPLWCGFTCPYLRSPPFSPPVGATPLHLAINPNLFLSHFSPLHTGSSTHHDFPLHPPPLFFLLCSVLCGQVSIYLAGWFTLEESTGDDSRGVSRLWCSVIVLTVCSQQPHTHTHTHTPVSCASRCHQREFVQRKALMSTSFTLRDFSPHEPTSSLRSSSSTSLTFLKFRPKVIRQVTPG